jgi:hypothetical protein
MNAEKISKAMDRLIAEIEGQPDDDIQDFWFSFKTYADKEFYKLRAKDIIEILSSFLESDASNW